MARNLLALFLHVFMVYRINVVSSQSFPVANVVLHSDDLRLNISKSMILNRTLQLAVVDIADDLYVQFDLNFVEFTGVNFKTQILQIGTLDLFVLNTALQLNNHQIGIINETLLLQQWYTITIYATRTTLQCWIEQQTVYANSSYIAPHSPTVNVLIGDDANSDNVIAIKRLTVYSVSKRTETSETVTVSGLQIVFGALCVSIICIVVLVLYYRRMRNAKSKMQEIEEVMSNEEENHDDNENHNTLSASTIESTEPDQDHAVSPQSTSKHVHVRRPSVEFEDIHSMESGKPLPLYISDNDDKSESSTFTASDQRHLDM